MKLLKSIKKYYELEIFKIKELSFSSNLINSIYQICQYLFEYNEDLLEHYKQNAYIHSVDNMIEQMEYENNLF